MELVMPAKFAQCSERLVRYVSSRNLSNQKQPYSALSTHLLCHQTFLPGGYLRWAEGLNYKIFKGNG